jgi:hypothetical protein
MLMKANVLGIIIVLLFAMASCHKAQNISLWERHCEACHDGKTMLNGKITLDREQMTNKYKNLDEFANACIGSASCMDILKHEKKLFREVGMEIGIKDTAGRQ